MLTPTQAGILAVTGPDPVLSIITGFPDKLPPHFDGHADYASYREYISILVNLTTLLADRHVPVLIGCLQGEAHTAAKTLSTEAIYRSGGTTIILERLDKVYAIYKVNQIYHDLASFLDYSRKKSVIVEHFISGSRTRVYKIAD